jgi:phosphoribosylamine--glycine ligase
MMTREGPSVLEFNARMGDPEMQPLSMRLESDLVPALMATAEGRLDEVELEWSPRPALCVMLASGGYPEDYEKGFPIEGVQDAQDMEDVQVFHSGTARRDGQLVTDGGRVLGVTARGDTIQDAQERAYEAVDCIHFEGMHYRTDIGQKALDRGD